MPTAFDFFIASLSHSIILSAKTVSSATIERLYPRFGGCRLYIVSATLLTVIGLSVSRQNPRRVSYISLPGGKYMRNGDSNYHFTLSPPKMAQALLSLALFAAGLFAPAAEVYAQTPSARLAVTVSPNTVTVGSAPNIKIDQL